jgi:IclR family transcriptional regulator, KDG regulon repressor
MPSISKIFKILELLRKHYRNGLNNKEISSELKIPPSTCYRILAELRKYELVYQRKPDLRYFLGFAHLRYAESVLEGMDISAICLPYLEDIHTETEETSFFALRNGSNCVVMETCGFTNMRIAVGRGEIMPLHCSAAGKAVLAFISRKEQQKILSNIDYKDYTSATITSRKELEQNLEEIRHSCMAYNNEEFHNGINAVAVPIFGSGNSVTGSIALVGTSIDLDRNQMEEYSSLILQAGIDISLKLGGSFPKEFLKKNPN